MYNSWKSSKSHFISCRELKCLCDLMEHSLKLSLYSQHDITLLTQRISLVFTTAPDEAFWAVWVIFFKVDVSCHPYGYLACFHQWSCWRRKAVTDISVSSTISCLSSDFLMMRQRKKYAKADRNIKSLQSTAVTLVCLLHILWADPCDCVCTCAVTVICHESNKTVWKTKKHVSAYWSSLII